MKPRQLRWTVAVSLIVVAALLVWVFLSAPKNPAARIRVVDAAGKPIGGVTISPRGLRTKPGPYQSGWYGWTDPKQAPVKTDANGYANISYPKFVFEKIETGVVIFTVSHPDFVPDSVERVATTKPPAGTPWKVWGNYLWDRLQHRRLMVPVEPVVLERGAILKVKVKQGPGNFKDGQLFVQVSGDRNEDSNYWQRPEPGMIMTRRLGEGKAAIRAVQFDAAGEPWFSEVISINAVAGKTNEVTVKLSRGAALRGKLDANVPRPVKNGRVIAHLWPRDSRPEESPPEWHAWASVREDGSFEIAGLPQGDLEVVALCDGYVSTNGPGKFKMRYPQKHEMRSNDLTITIGMERTARLEVQVTDMQGKPVKDAMVAAWPNVRYGEWSAVILAEDCYKTSDSMLPGVGKKSRAWGGVPPDFSGKSDETGLAILPNLPVTVTEIAVQHPTLALPAVADSTGQKRREARVTLEAGVTNHASLRLEPEEQSPIKHY